MKKSEINIRLLMDENHVPERISWMASDKGEEPMEARAMNVSFWDGATRETLKMDLWTKEMPVQEMEMFYVDIVGSMAETVIQSTNNEKLAAILHKAGEDMMDLITKDVPK